VLYLLDADRSFGMSMDIVEWLGYGNDINDVIIVGIGYGGTNERWWNLRARDFTPTKDKEKKMGNWPETGGARNFQMFLEKELFPTIEARYTASADQRTLFGFDLGGLFGSFILLTKPELFKNYVLISPSVSWDDRYIFQLEKKFSNRNKELNANVMVMMGGLDSKENYLIPGSEFVETLRNRDYRGFSLSTHRYDNDTHFSVFPLALTDAIKILYKKE
jgi:predicted alpha/beta superfamily hydrolase